MTCIIIFPSYTCNYIWRDHIMKDQWMGYNYENINSFKSLMIPYSYIYIYIYMDVNVLVIGYTQEMFSKVKLALMLMKVAKIVETLFT